VSFRRWFALGLLASSAALISVSPARASVGFQPISPDELKMTSEPQAPGAPAIILYHQVDRDDYGRTSHGGAAFVGSTSSRFEDNYFRIKILTDAGRRYADVEIPLPREVGSIDVINARTIRPDGSVVNFSGQVFEKTIVKTKGFQYLAKTFTLSDVQVGSIIEYYYTITFREGYVYNSQWILSNELFTKRAKFSLRPFQNEMLPLSFRWSEQLPPGSPSTKQGTDGIVRLEVANIGAFQPEDFMPPENELKARVDFIYSMDPFEMDVSKFWRKVGKKRNDEVERFVGKHGAMEQAVAQIVSPSDSAEVKLQKLYARVQQLQNTSYEVKKTEQELKHDNRKTDENVEDVWKRGYGDARQLTWLYLALVRAAGFEAYDVAVPDRRYDFFNPQSMDSGRLDANVILVKSNGKDLFFDPGSAFTPFGLLRWEETGVQGLRLDRDGGTWVQTALPPSTASRIERKAELKLSDTGSLEGKIVVTFTGLEAMRRRVDERNQDETTRKRFLEDQVKGYIPVPSDVTLTNKPDWTSSEPALVAEFRVEVPIWAPASGHRALFPAGVFSAPEKQIFDYSQRVHPVYFEYLSQKLDDVTIELPVGWQVTGMPKKIDQDMHVVAYASGVEDNKGTLHLTRKLDINILLLETKFYTPLRSFFQIVKKGDEQLIILQPGTAVSAN
jgi:transglutaminase-like putative cysteine protease